MGVLGNTSISQMPPDLQPLQASSAWFVSNNPIPENHRLCIETDTGYWKVGDGISQYSSLLYLNTIVDLFTASFSLGNPPTLTKVSHSQNLVYASPNGSSGVPTFRALVAADLPGGGGGGVTSLSAIGSTPNANGATITGTVLNLEPASASFGGVVTTLSQTFAGAKTFNDQVTIGDGLVFNQNSSGVSGSNADINVHPNTNIRLTNGGLVSLASISTSGVVTGHQLWLHNDTGNSVIIVNNYGSSPVGSKPILTSFGANINIPNQASIILEYDSTDSAWRLVGNVGFASASYSGYLSSTDWSTFNSKQNALSGTGFVKISGTTISYDNTSYQPLATNLTSLSTLTYASTSFVKMTASGTFALDTASYLTSISGTPNRISVSGSTIDISATYVGQTSITTLGTIGTGTWQGTAIADTYISSASTWNSKQNGSTNLTSLSGLTYASLSFVKMSASGTFSLDTNTYLTSVGTGTTNELTYWSGTNTLGSLTTATYPSLTELSYVKGVTSAIQTQFTAKKTIATGNAYKFETTDASGNLQETTVTASRAVVTDANGLPSASATTSTEIGYVSGVTSAIQTQINTITGAATTQSRLRSAATSLTTATTTNVTATALTLGAGTWDISAMVGYLTGTTPQTNTLFAAVSQTSATLPATDTDCVPNSNGEVRVEVLWAANTALVSSSTHAVVIPTYRVVLAGSTTFYLLARAVFGTSTMSAFGSISARQVK